MGALVWETYREFEVAMSSLDPDNAKQKDRIDKLFRRQLAVPLMHMQETLKEYKEFLANGDSSMDVNVMNAYNKALEMLKPREELESKLIDLEESGVPREEEKLQVYSDYLALEFGSERNPARLQNLFERRITEACLHSHCWIKYVDYLDKTLKTKEVSLPVYARAVRNVPNCADLWLKYLRALEKYGESVIAIKLIFEVAISKNFTRPDVTQYTDLWLAYVDCYRRKTDFEDEDGNLIGEKQEEMRGIFTTGQSFLQSYKADPECRVLRYMALVEADTFKSMPEARKIWSDVISLSKSGGDSAKLWLEYAQLEANFGSIKHQRKVYQRALERVKSSDPTEIAESWLAFERMEGDLNQVEDCEAKIEAKMKKWRQAQKEVDVTGGSSHSKKTSATTSPSGKKQQKQQKQQQHPQHKQQHQQNKDMKRKRGKSETQPEPAFKKPSLPSSAGVSGPSSSSSNATASTSSSKAVKPPPGFKEPEPPKKPATKPPPGYVAEPEEKPAGAAAKVVKPPPGYSADKKEPTKVKPPPGWSGDVTQTAVKPPPGWSDDVASEKPTTSSSSSKPDDLDKNRTVFLSNLDFSVTEAEIEAALKESMKDSVIGQVRLVKNYAGKSKGFCYVVLGSGEDAAKALKLA